MFLPFFEKKRKKKICDDIVFSEKVIFRKENPGKYIK